MDYLKKRQKSRKRLYSKVTIVGLVLVLLFLVSPTWKIIQKSRESKANLEHAREELAELETRRTSLARDVAYLNTDSGQDQEIRNKFGVAKDGETMVVIVRNEDQHEAKEAVPTAGFFSRIWTGFLSVFGID